MVLLACPFYEASLWDFILVIELSSFSLSHLWGPKVRTKPENLLKESFGDERGERELGRGMA